MNAKTFLSALLAIIPLSFPITVAAQAMFIAPTGDVGIGTPDPKAKLHVEGAEDPKILVRRTSGIKQERTMFTLSNNAKTRFLITNGPNAWTFDNAGISFQISKVGTGTAEFELFENGDGFFGGDVYANEFLLSSSKELKTDFAPIDGMTILKQLAQLEISSWRYKVDDESKRHVGPVAEDFRSVFALGDGHTISNVDVSGIAFAAIKALYESNKRYSSEIDELKSQKSALERRLNALEEYLYEKN
jgi:hypothetical protein